MLLEVDTYRPMEIVASFKSVFQYAWPGALGGQYVFWDEKEKAFCFSESRRKVNSFFEAKPCARRTVRRSSVVTASAPR